MYLLSLWRLPLVWKTSGIGDCNGKLAGGFSFQQNKVQIGLFVHFGTLVVAQCRRPELYSLEEFPT